GGRDRLNEGLLLHRHAAVRVGRERVHLVGHPLGGRPDAAVRVRLAGSRVPGAERDELEDRGPDPVRVDRAWEGAEGGGVRGTGGDWGGWRPAQNRRREAPWPPQRRMPTGTPGGLYRPGLEQRCSP